MTRELVRQAFSKHFPGFDSLSPFDPVRVMADAITTSWSDVARTQHELFTTVLSGLPDLLGYHARSARPHSVLASLRASGDHCARIPGGTRVNLSGEPHGLEGTTTAEVWVGGVQSFSHQLDDTTRVIRVRAGASPLLGVSVFFSPSAKTEASTHDVRATDSTLRVEDHTSGWSRPGTLTITRRDGAPLCTNAELEIRLEGPSGRHGHGDLLLGSTSLNVYRRVQWLELGKLSGTPWQEISLPEGLLRVPSELHIDFPTGERCVAELVEGDRILSGNPDTALGNRVFVYHSGRHSILFPFAHLLCAGFHAALPVILEPAECAVETLLLATPGAAKLRASIKGVDENLEVRGILEISRPRESLADLRKRFFASLREHKRTWARDGRGDV